MGPLAGWTTVATETPTRAPRTRETAWRGRASPANPSPPRGERSSAPAPRSRQSRPSAPPMAPGASPSGDPTPTGIPSPAARPGESPDPTPRPRSPGRSPIATGRSAMIPTACPPIRPGAVDAAAPAGDPVSRLPPGALIHRSAIPGRSVHLLLRGRQRPGEPGIPNPSTWNPRSSTTPGEGLGPEKPGQRSSPQSPRAAPHGSPIPAAGPDVGHAAALTATAVKPLSGARTGARRS